MADKTLASAAVRLGVDATEAEKVLREFSHSFQNVMKEMTEGARGRYKKNIIVDEAVAQAERIKQIQQDSAITQQEIDAKFAQQDLVRSRAEFQRMEIMRNSGYAKMADDHEKALRRQQDADHASAQMQKAVNEGRMSDHAAWYKVYLSLIETEEGKRVRILQEAAAKARAAIAADNKLALEETAKVTLEAKVTEFAKRLMDMTRGYKGVLEGVPMTSRFSPILAEGAALGVTGGAEIEELQRRHQMDLKLQSIRGAERRANINQEFELAVELHRMAGQLEADINRSVHDQAMDQIEKEARANIQATKDEEAATLASDARTAAERVKIAQEADRKMSMDSRLRQAERLRETLRDPADPRKGTFAREASQLESMVRFEEQIRTQFADAAKVLQVEQQKAAVIMHHAFMKGDKETFDAAARAYDHFGEQIKQTSDGKVKAGAANARYAVMNLAYGVQDAATVWENSGFAGAIRASANNMTALGQLMGESAGKASDLRAAFASPEVALIAFSTALMMGADTYAKYQKAEKEFFEQRKKLLADAAEGRLATVENVGKQVDEEKELRDLAEGQADAVRKRVRDQGDLVDKKKAELEAAKKLRDFELQQLLKANTKVQEEEKRLRDMGWRVPKKGSVDESINNFVGTFAEATVNRLGELVENKNWMNYDEFKLQQLREYAESHKKALQEARHRVRELTGEVNKNEDRFGKFVGILQKLIGLETEAANKAREQAEADRIAEEQARNDKAFNDEAERQKKKDERDKDKADRKRTEAEIREERKISDIAIAQAERILRDRQAALKATYDVPMPGMAEARSQEAANIRARAMRKEAEGERKEMQELLRVAKDSLEEQRMIREAMQPGYLVESFKP